MARCQHRSPIKETAEQLGVELRFFDAQQKQENQIEAVRKLIIQKVDVIGISPIVETGWDEVFQEAKDAGIPIILVDRRADVPEDLYVSYLGSDFLEEGRNAARIMADLVGGKANIVELVGTIGSAPANDRYTGFREVLKDYPEMQIIDSQSGDFTRARGQGSDGGISAKAMATKSRQSMPITMIWRWARSRQSKSMVSTRGGYQDRFGGCRPRCVRSDDRRQAKCHGGVQSAARSAVLRAGVESGQWRTHPQVGSIHEGIFFPEDAAKILPTRKY